MLCPPRRTLRRDLVVSRSFVGDNLFRRRQRVFAPLLPFDLGNRRRWRRGSLSALDHLRHPCDPQRVRGFRMITEYRAPQGPEGPNGTVGPRRQGLTLSHGSTVRSRHAHVEYPSRSKRFGGAVDRQKSNILIDPSVGSPADTLLRLLHPPRTDVQ